MCSVQNVYEVQFDEWKYNRVGEEIINGYSRYGGYAGRGNRKIFTVTYTFGSQTKPEDTRTNIEASDDL